MIRAVRRAREWGLAQAFCVRVHAFMCHRAAVGKRETCTPCAPSVKRVRPPHAREAAALSEREHRETATSRA